MTKQSINDMPLRDVSDEMVAFKAGKRSRPRPAIPEDKLVPIISAEIVRLRKNLYETSPDYRKLGKLYMLLAEIMRG